MEEPSFATLNERPLYNKSYKSFLYTSTGRQKGPDKPTLPDPQVCRGYVDLYFKFVGPYTAVVHRPTVEALVRHDLLTPQLHRHVALTFE